MPPMPRTKARRDGMTGFSFNCKEVSCGAMTTVYFIVNPPAETHQLHCAWCGTAQYVELNVEES